MENLKNIVSKLKAEPISEGLQRDYRRLGGSFNINLKPSLELMSEALKMSDENDNRLMNLDIDAFASKLQAHILKSGVALNKETYASNKNEINNFFTGLSDKYSGATDETTLRLRSDLHNNLDNAFIKSEIKRSVDLSKRVLKSNGLSWDNYNEKLGDKSAQDSVKTLNQFMGEAETHDYVKSQKRIAFMNSVMDADTPVARIINEGQELGFTKAELFRIRDTRSQALLNVASVKTTDIDSLNETNQSGLDTSLIIDQKSRVIGGYDITNGYLNYKESIETDPTLSAETKALRVSQADTYYQKSREQLLSNPLDYGIARKMFTPSGTTVYSPYNKHLSRIDAIKETMNFKGDNIPLTPFTSTEIAKIRAGNLGMISTIRGLLTNLNFRNGQDSQIYTAIMEIMKKENPRLYMLSQINKSESEIEQDENDFKMKFPNIDVETIANKALTPTFDTKEELRKTAIDTTLIGTPYLYGAAIHNPNSVVDLTMYKKVQQLYNTDPLFKAVYLEGVKEQLGGKVAKITSLEDLHLDSLDVLKRVGVTVDKNTDFINNLVWGLNSTSVPKFDKSKYPFRQKGLHGKILVRQIDVNTGVMVDEDGRKIVDNVNGQPFYFNLVTGDKK